MAANHPVSRSEEFRSCTNVNIILSHKEWLINLSWPSALEAKQLIAKQAFLLEPVSFEHSMVPVNIAKFSVSHSIIKIMWFNKKVMLIYYQLQRDSLS